MKSTSLIAVVVFAASTAAGVHVREASAVTYYVM